MSEGVPAERLSDDLLRHELAQLKRVQSDIEAHGTDAQRANHAVRTRDLEAEFVKRHGSASKDGDDQGNPSQ